MEEDEVNGEERSQSLGAYENMERSDIYPSFYSGRSSEEDDVDASIEGRAKGALRNAEKNAAKEGAKKIASKVATKGLDAATGGVGGKAVEAAAKAGQKLGIGKNGKGLPFVGKIAAAGAPAIIIGLCLILFCFAFLPFLQWLFPWGYQARMLEENNTTQVSAQAYSDEMLDSSQLEECGTKSSVADVSYNDMGFTDLQVEELKNSGLDIRQYDDCSTALIYQDSNGNDIAVVSSNELGHSTDGALAEGTTALTDSGSTSTSQSDDERRTEILAKLDLAANTSSVKSFEEAMKDKNFADRYRRGSEYWRGEIAGWYTDMREQTINRQAISYDNFNDFDTSGSEEDVEKRVMDLYKSKLERSSSNNNSGGKSLNELVTEVANDSSNDTCGTSSAFTKIEGVTTADQTLKQEIAGSFLLESIDKTRAGDGQTAPLNAILNVMNKASATTAPGIMSLFTNTKLKQSDKLVQEVSAQAHGNDSQIGVTVNDGEYRECIYEGNTDDSIGGKKGAIATISSMFKKIGDAIKNFATSIKNLIFGKTSSDGTSPGGGGSNSAQISTALSNVISNFDTMKNQELLTGNDTAMLGEAMASASERQITEKAQSGGLTLGTPAATKLTYRAQQEIIAEQADYDRRNKSPFDISSRYTFLGSLAYTLMPFALASQNPSLTTTTSNIGSAISDSLVALLPTSSAVGETEVNLGDCVLSNNIGGASNPHCISYRNPDLTMASQTAPQVFDTVANLRFDEAGYVYGTDTNATIEGDDGASGNSGTSAGDVKVLVFALGTNDRGETHGGGAPELSQSNINKLESSVGEDTIVFLVSNVDTEWSPKEGMYNNNNSLINAAVNAHKNWHLLDWRATATTSDIKPNDPEEWNVHPNAQGVKKWVDMIANAVKETGVDGKEIAIIGDSITNMTTSELESAIPGAYVHGVDGRTWNKAIEDESSTLAKTKGDSGNQNVSGSGSTTIGRGTRQKDDPDWGDGPLNAAENDLGAHWTNKVAEKQAEFYAAYPNYIHTIIGSANGCESDWEMRLQGLTYILDYTRPTEWSYSRYTNFEYEGYESGWHNRKKNGSTGIERAQNTVDPGSCLLDIKLDSSKQPVINRNSALGMFLIASGQRSSEWGVTDDSNLQIIARTDFTKGRMHPCVVGADEICKAEPYTSLEWTGSVTSDGTPSDDLLKNTSYSMSMSPWIGGSAFVMYNGDLATLEFMESTVQNNNRYQDATRNKDWFWNEMKWYQAFTIINEWMENIGKINTATTTVAVQNYYEENPLDNSYEGIIARRSGLSKQDVIAVLNLIDHIEFLANYDPNDLYPLPAPKPEKMQFNQDEVVIIAENIIQNNAIVYDELRNRTITV